MKFPICQKQNLEKERKKVGLKSENGKQNQQVKVVFVIYTDTQWLYIK